MSLRIGFDMDGVLADFASAFRRLEVHLFGNAVGVRPSLPDDEQQRQSTDEAGAPLDESAGVSESRRRSDAIWAFIRSTPDFWTLLRPTQKGAVKRLHELTLRYRWEVFFITQRPATAGDTVQRQTQRWLIAQGFDMPSVLMIDGSRGAAAAALHLDYHVDDNPQNCLDVLSDARARPLLVAPAGDLVTVRKARGLGIGVAHSIGECLEILEHASYAQQQPGMFQRLAEAVGWGHRTTHHGPPQTNEDRSRDRTQRTAR